MTFNQLKIWLIVGKLLVALCGVSDGAEPGGVLIIDDAHQFPPGHRPLTAEEFSQVKRIIKNPRKEPAPRKKVAAVLAQDIEGLSAIVFVDDGGFAECAYLMYLTREKDTDNFKGMTTNYVNLSEIDRLAFRKLLKIDK